LALKRLFARARKLAAGTGCRAGRYARYTANERIVLLDYFAHAKLEQAARRLGGFIRVIFMLQPIFYKLPFVDGLFDGAKAMIAGAAPHGRPVKALRQVAIGGRAATNAQFHS